MADNGPLIDDGDRWVHVGKPQYRHANMIYLEHSCDEWVIGNEGDALRMIRELTQAIDELNATRHE